MTLLEQYEHDRPPKHLTTLFDKLVCPIVQQCYERGWNLILEAQPRSNKSSLCNVYGPAWFSRTHPNFKHGLISHSATLANKFVGGYAVLLRGKFAFQYERSAEVKLAGSEGIDPSYWGSGISGGHTGKGCHRLILDDMLRSGSDALSEVVRESIITDVISTALNRLEPFGNIPGAVSILQARLHQADPIGWALNESGLRFVRIHLPATNDDGTKAYIDNGYTEEKRFVQPYDCLFPGRFPRTKIDEMKALCTQYFYYAQYEQEPSLGTDVYFDMTRCPRFEQMRVRRWWIGCDFANTATATGSRSALVALGEDNGVFMVLGCSYGRWRPAEMGEQLLAFAEAVRRLVGFNPVAVVVERAAGGYGVADELRNVMPIEELIPRGSKEERAGAVCYLVNRGSVGLPEGGVPWLKEFEKEVQGFPLSPLNDIPDAFVHCLSYAARPSEFKPKQTEFGVGYDPMTAYQLEGGGIPDLESEFDEAPQNYDTRNHKLPPWMG